MYQVLKAMGRDIQGGRIEGVFVFVSSGALRAQNLVDLILDLQQFRFAIGVPYSSPQRIE